LDQNYGRFSELEPKLKPEFFFKNGFTITFKCGTRTEMVLIYFSEPELEVQHRSKEPANNNFYFIGRGLEVPKFIGLAS
jgi:hypothetical protein